MTPMDVATCGHCELSWDDSIPTSMTPAPSARCPFEAFHAEDGSPLDPDDIPADFPVQPIDDDDEPDGAGREPDLMAPDAAERAEMLHRELRDAGR